MEKLTLLNADSKVLTKQITWTQNDWEKKSYDSCTLFTIFQIDVSSIFSLSDTLFSLEGIENCCVIRGVPVNSDCGDEVRRTLTDLDPKRPQTIKPNPAGVSWVMLDFDKIPVMSYNFTKNKQRLDYLVSLLPAEFQDVTFHYQWSASAGLENWDFLSCHLFFWLDKPWPCKVLRERFERGDFQYCDVDAACFTENQIHYTAAPIFTNCIDPLLGIRSNLVKKSVHEVPLSPWVQPKPVPQPEWTGPPSTTQNLRRFGELLGEIGPHYHVPILRAVAHYISITPSAEVDEGFLKTRVKDAINCGAPGKSSKGDYLCDRYLNRIIRDARRKFGR